MTAVALYDYQAGEDETKETTKVSKTLLLFGSINHPKVREASVTFMSMLIIFVTSLRNGTFHIIHYYYDFKLEYLKLFTVVMDNSSKQPSSYFCRSVHLNTFIYTTK